MGGLSKWLKPKNVLDATLTSADPAGLVYQSKNKELQKVQNQQDWLNIAARPRQRVKKQKKQAAIESTRVYENDLLTGTSRSYIPGVQI